jgi:hypothetical protein
MIQVTLNYISLLTSSTHQLEGNTQQLVESLLVEVENASADIDAHASFDVKVRRRSNRGHAILAAVQDVWALEGE